MEFLSALGDTIIAFIKHVPVELWHTLASAVLISPASAGVKHWLHINRGWIMFTVVSLGSLVAAWISYITSTPEFGPWIILVQGFVTYWTTQPVYYAFVKRIAADWATAWANSKAYEQELMSAALPAPEPATEPVSSVKIDDFAPPSR